jgi:hypothetical protein
LEPREPPASYWKINGLTDEKEEREASKAMVAVLEADVPDMRLSNEVRLVQLVRGCRFAQH